MLVVLALGVATLGASAVVGFKAWRRQQSRVIPEDPSGAEVEVTASTELVAVRTGASPGGMFIAPKGPPIWDVRLYSAETGALVRTLSDRDELGVDHFAFSPSGDLLATVVTREFPSRRRVLRLWGVDGHLGFSAELFADPRWQCHKEHGLVHFSPGGEWLAATDDAGIEVFSVETRALRFKIPRCEGLGDYPFALLQGGKLLAGSDGLSITIVELETGKLLRSVPISPPAA